MEKEILDFNSSKLIFLLYTKHKSRTFYLSGFCAKEVILKRNDYCSLNNEESLLIDLVTSATDVSMSL